MLKRNVVELVGNLVDDPDFKDMGDFQVANFFLAVDRLVELNDGQTADFVPIVCKNDLAKTVESYARKGRRVFIDGRLQVRVFEDDQRNRRWVTEIVAHRLQYLDPPPEDVMNGNQGNRNTNQGANYQGNSGGQRGNYRGNSNNNGRSNQSEGNNGGNRSGGGRSQGSNGGYANRGNSGGNQRYGNSGSGNQRYGNSGAGQGQGQGYQGYSQSGSGGGGGRRLGG